MNNSRIPHENKAIIVLGMHRSGTSAIAAGLEAMGFALGKKYVTIQYDNQKGYFENEDVVSFDDHLLQFLNSRWDNPFFDGRRALADCEEHELAPWYEEADAIIRENFSGYSRWAVKDPRMCQLLSFWTSVLERNGYLGTDTYYIHVLRHPLEVAHSQLQRHRKNPGFHYIGGDLRQTVLLWLSSHLQALREVNSDNNIAILFTDLLEEPALQMERIIRFLDIDISRDSLKEYLDDFLERSLKHHTLDESENDQLKKKYPEAVYVYDALSRLSKENSFDRDDIQNILKNIDSYAHALDLFHPMYPLLSVAWYDWQDMIERHREVMTSYTWRMANKLRNSLIGIPGMKTLFGVLKKIYDFFSGRAMEENGCLVVHLIHTQKTADDERSITRRQTSV
ncbi:MAG: sulfotransferase [Deltaproteobacteria bacterium]|nr:sulfotransferase [Candidatus Zymogenaceae bacterium]